MQLQLELGGYTYTQMDKRVESLKKMVWMCFMQTAILHAVQQMRYIWLSLEFETVI